MDDVGLTPGSERIGRTGRVRADRRPLVEGVDFVPERVGRGEVAAARKLLDSEGAVIVCDWPLEVDSVVIAAATVFGTGLRRLEAVQHRTRTDTASTGDTPSQSLLHRDGGYSLVNVDGNLVPLRLVDPDHVLILCHGRAPSGGESVVVDMYRLLGRLRSDDPELYGFLTSVDVDVWARFIDERTRHSPPYIRRMVEWTRGGKMLVRTGEYAESLPDDPLWEEHDTHLQDYVDVCATLEAQAGRGTILEAGEVLIVDNYRCLHGIRDHEGARTTSVLRCQTVGTR